MLKGENLMNKLFPSMLSKPEPRQIIALVPCWMYVFVLVPLYMPFLASGLWEQWESSVWFDIIYHAINGLIVLFLLRNYLKDEWFMVSTDAGTYLKHAALTAGLILGAEIVLIGVVYLSGWDVWYMLNALPVAEMAVAHTPLSLIYYEPVVGAIVLTILVPICLSGLYYCLCFAPICYRRPWLAYLSIPVITFLPALVDILYRREQTELALGAYLVALPIHLLACWSYQKTDNAWTPIFTLALVNLVLSIIFPFAVLPFTA